MTIQVSLGGIGVMRARDRVRDRGRAGVWSGGGATAWFDDLRVEPEPEDRSAAEPVRLLVVEDERDLAQTLRRALEEEEFAVDLAERRRGGAVQDPRDVVRRGRPGSDAAPP